MNGFDKIEMFDNKEYYENIIPNINLSLENKISTETQFNPSFNLLLHEQILQDEIRILSFKSVIESNSNFFKDKIVIEIGSGLGILSILAAQNGAKHVYLLENSDMIYLADKVVSDNNLKEKITLIRGNPENSKEKLQPADIIISDWMGYFLMHDSNIESVIYARDNCLKKEGVLIPDSAIIHIAAIEDEELFNSKYRFWENVHDIDMSLIKNASLSEVLVETAEKEKILSSIFKIYELDLYTAQENDLEFSTKYQLTITKSQKMHGLISWFDVFMNSLPYKVKFNTSPFNQSTSWKQCIFYLDEELQVEKGDILNGSFAFRNSLENEYHLDFKISFHLFRKNVNIYNKIKLYKLRI